MKPIIDDFENDSFLILCAKNLFGIKKWLANSHAQKVYKV